MTKRALSERSGSIDALLLMVAAPVFAQGPADLAGEPDSSIAPAHESFVKGEAAKAAQQLHKAADYVRKQSDKVTASAKNTVRQAGDALDQLGRGVEKGTVKSADQLKKTFAQVDHQLAT